MAAHKDSPSGQQFHVRYDYVYDNGSTHTLWSRVYGSRDEAEKAKRRHEKWGDGNVRIFVRDLSPWREDTGPEPCGNCGQPKNEHPGDPWSQGKACMWWSK